MSYWVLISDPATHSLLNICLLSSFLFSASSVSLLQRKCNPSLFRNLLKLMFPVPACRHSHLPLLPPPPGRWDVLPPQVNPPLFKSVPHPDPTTVLCNFWAKYVTFLCLDLLIFKAGIITAAASEGCCKNRLDNAYGMLNTVFIKSKLQLF